MRKIILLLFIPLSVYAQIFKPFPNGLTVELSANYPTLSWEINESNQANGDRQELWIKPNLQIGYNIKIFDNIYAKPFVGIFPLEAKARKNLSVIKIK